MDILLTRDDIAGGVLHQVIVKSLSTMRNSGGSVNSHGDWGEEGGSPQLDFLLMWLSDWMKLTPWAHSMKALR